uniref:Uncharacterized protein n=1 Tax=Timema genevievae TaxID=629358 RepID=A0A7R9PLW7_TIMGE|nr:unnamed protein product [Timema genevievae]
MEFIHASLAELRSPRYWSVTVGPDESGPITTFAEGVPLEFAAFGVLSHSYKRTPRPINNMMAVAAAQKNREMFAIKKSYSIERTELDAEKRRWVVPSTENDR